MGRTTKCNRFSNGLAYQQHGEGCWLALCALPSPYPILGAGKGFGHFASQLCVVWETHEKEILKAFFPAFSEEQIGELACQTISNSEFTAHRPDIHAHVRIATKATWASGNIARVVDDARAPKLIVKEAIEAARRDFNAVVAPLADKPLVQEKNGLLKTLLHDAVAGTLGQEEAGKAKAPFGVKSETDKKS